MTTNKTNLNGDKVEILEANENIEIFKSEEVKAESNSNSKEQGSEADEISKIDSVDKITFNDETEPKSDPMELQDFADSINYDIEFNEDEELEEDKETKEKYTKKIYTIDRVEVGQPKQFDNEGNKIAPLISDNGALFYESKLIVFYKDSTYKSVIPKIKWYVNKDITTGKETLTPWFAIKEDSTIEEQFISVLSKVYYKFCKYMNLESGKVSMKDFITKLPGLKVNLYNTKGKFKGTTWNRIDIVKFVK